MKEVLSFTVGKECKHSVRYEPETDNKVLDTIYVKKTGLPTPYPQTLKVTVETAG